MQQPTAAPVINPNFDEIGKYFVREYYSRFDNKQTRPEVLQFYSNDPNELPLLTFESEKFMGKEPIQKKLVQDFNMGSLKREITKVDSQPMFNGGVLVSVLGQLQSADSEGDKPMGFSQVFILKPAENSFFIQHDVFTLTLHNSAV